MSDPTTPLHLHLSWNSYSSVYSSSFSSLRKHPRYEDVTLVVDDGHAVAHKILLATCSPLLSSIMELSTNTGVVYLNNISIKNLNLVLDFMYTGEANVDNEDLHEFLAAASTLKVRGLTEIVHEDEKKKEELKVNTLANKKRKVLENDAEPIQSIIQNENDPLKENKSLNMEIQAGMKTPMFEDNTLPQGWHRKVTQRKSGASAGKYDVLIIGPTKQKFRSSNELKNFFNKTGETSLNLKQFDFSIFGRNNPKGPTNKSTTPTMSEAWTGLYCEPVLQDAQTIKNEMNEGGPQGTFDNGIQGSSFEQEVIEVIDISLEDSPDATLVSDPIQADSSSSVQLPPRSTLPPHTSSSRSIQLPPGIKLPPSISLTSVDNSSYKKRKLSTPEYLRFK